MRERKTDKEDESTHTDTTAGLSSLASLSGERALAT